MKKVFTTIGIVFAILVVGYFGLHWWTTTYRDKPVNNWIQNVLDKDDNEESSDSSLVDEMILEDGAQSIALIKF